MNYLMAYQKMSATFDMVYYIGTGMDQPLLITYKKFIEYANTLDIKNYSAFKEELDTYKTLIINMDTKEWFEYVAERRTDIPFEEMLELNKDKARIVDLRKGVEVEEEKSDLQKMRDRLEGISKNRGTFGKEKKEKPAPRTILDRLWGKK